MKIKDTDKFRKELYRNLKEVFFSGIELTEFESVGSDEEVTRPCVFTKLDNVLQMSGKKETYYLTVEEINSVEICFWRFDADDFYKLEGWVDCLDYPNKTIVMMGVVQKIISLNI